MTSYSTYGTGRLRLVDGSLHTDDETAEEQIFQIVQCIGSGAVRALLDTTTDLADGGAQVDATQWHSAAEGWELNAVIADDLAPFMEMVERFVRENTQNILTLASRIAWDRRWANEMWTWDEGMAIYRIGMLLGYELHGDGIGFDDYFQPLLVDGELPEHPRDGVIEQLSAWVDSRENHLWYEDTWIDSTEEPCLLHLRG